MWLNVMLLAVGGAAGTVARVGLSTAVNRLHVHPMPWGTVAVNLLGCFLFGLVWSLADRRGLHGGSVALLLLAGFMGAFTTFSTFAFEVAQHLRGTHLGWAAANLVLQNGAGVALVIGGLAAGRSLWPAAQQ